MLTHYKSSSLLSEPTVALSETERSDGSASTGRQPDPPGPSSRDGDSAGSRWPALTACATSVDQDDGAATTGGDPAARLTMHHDAAVGPLFQPYVDDFNERCGPLSLDTSYGTTDYAGTTNTQLAGGGVDYDVLFTDPGHSQRWYDNGWIAKLDDFPGAGELSESWLPGLLAEYQAEDGSLIALPYYRGIEPFLYDAEHLERIGAQPPRTWDEFVEQCRELKSAGVGEFRASSWTVPLDAGARPCEAVLGFRAEDARLTPADPGGDTGGEATCAMTAPTAYCRCSMSTRCSSSSFRRCSPGHT
jgi:ABC-type glycerol-3-phosphate transport system substrate-binding protein